MKKLFLLLLSGSIVNGAYAQSSIVFEHQAALPIQTFTGYPVNNVPPSKASQGNYSVKAHKTTNGGSRWYNHRDVVNTLNNGAMTNVVFPMWFDSTVRQVFSTGPSTVNWSSAAECVDPIDFTEFNDAALFDPSTIVVSNMDDYIVDSIDIQGAYVKSSSRPTSIIDTLIFSVEIDSSEYKHSENEPGWTFAQAYVPGGADSMLYYPRIWTDSIGRAGFSTNSSVPAIKWYVTLGDADRTLPTVTSMGQTYTTKNYTIAVPNGGLHVPAGSHFAYTCTFKSGDTWTANVDSVENFHRFMPVSGEGLGTNKPMPYYYYNYGDLNSSMLLFSVATGRYQPSLIIEGDNTTAFAFEFHGFESHITCSTCLTIADLSVGNIASPITANAYPNPANNGVSIPFSLVSKSYTTVTISNVMGQVLKTRDMGSITNGAAQFNVFDLPNGVYFYTVYAGENRNTGRLVVAH